MYETLMQWMILLRAFLVIFITFILLKTCNAVALKYLFLLVFSVGTKDPKIQLCDMKSGSRIQVLQG